MTTRVIVTNEGPSKVTVMTMGHSNTAESEFTKAIKVLEVGESMSDYVHGTQELWISEV